MQITKRPLANLPARHYKGKYFALLAQIDREARNGTALFLQDEGDLAKLASALRAAARKAKLSVCTQVEPDGVWVWVNETASPAKKPQAIADPTPPAVETVAVVIPIKPPAPPATPQPVYQPPRAIFSDPKPQPVYTSEDVDVTKRCPRCRSLLLYDKDEQQHFCVCGYRERVPPPADIDLPTPGAVRQ